MDLTILSDEQLDAKRVDVLCEQERRANLALIPEQIAEMAAKFRDGGGDPDALTDAISDPHDGGLDLYEVDED